MKRGILIIASGFLVSVVSVWFVAGWISLDFSRLLAIVVTPRIAITQPNGTEKIGQGEKYQIWWSFYYNPATSFDIYLLSIDPATSEIVSQDNIATNISRSGYPTQSYLWTVLGNQPPGSYTIQICSRPNNICDSTDQPFTIQALFIKVTNPTANTIIAHTQTLPIVWDAAGFDLGFTLKLRKPNGTLVQFFTTGPQVRSYAQWSPSVSIPEAESGTGYQIVVGGTTPTTSPGAVPQAPSLPLPNSKLMTRLTPLSNT